MPNLTALQASAALVALSLAACTPLVSRSVSVPASKSTEQSELGRTAWLLNHRGWSLEGWATLSHRGKEKRGRIKWRQRNRGFDISLRAPNPRNSWRLVGDSHHEGGWLERPGMAAVDGEEADELLFEQTGWVLPVLTFEQWARGEIDRRYPGGTKEFGPDGQLSSIKQISWTIRYGEWHNANADRPSMPWRIEAKGGEADGGDATIHLVIDRWTFDSRYVP